MTDIMKQYNQLQRAYEAQAEENADLALLADQYKAERDALQAKLDEMGEQEPPKCVMKITVHDKDWTLDYLSLPVGKHELYTKSYVYNAAPKALEPVKFLVNGARFKLANCGPSSSGFVGFPKELAGRWVALVAADDDCHLKFAAPKALEPLTVETYTAIAHRTASRYAHRSDPTQIVYTFFPHTLDDFVRKLEAAHGITKGTPT